MNKVKLTIDGRKVFAWKDSTILKAAKGAEIRIPTLCFHERTKPIGSCGMCVVEVDGDSTPVAVVQDAGRGGNDRYHIVGSSSRDPAGFVESSARQSSSGLSDLRQSRRVHAPGPGLRTWHNKR